MWWVSRLNIILWKTMCVKLMYLLDLRWNYLRRLISILFLMFLFRRRLLVFFWLLRIKYKWRSEIWKLLSLSFFTIRNLNRGKSCFSTALMYRIIIKRLFHTQFLYSRSRLLLGIKWINMRGIPKHTFPNFINFIELYFKVWESCWDVIIILKL